MHRYAVAMFLIFPLAAHAQFVSGNQLLDLCRTDPTAAAGYVAGAVDTIQTVQDNKLVEKNICIRANVTIGQMVDLVCAYARAHPEFRDFAGSAQVAAAMSITFPCR